MDVHFLFPYLSIISIVRDQHQSHQTQRKEHAGSCEWWRYEGQFRDKSSILQRDCPGPRSCSWSPPSRAHLGSHASKMPGKWIIIKGNKADKFSSLCSADWFWAEFLKKCSKHLINLGKYVYNDFNHSRITSTFWALFTCLAFLRTLSNPYWPQSTSPSPRPIYELLSLVAWRE